MLNKKTKILYISGVRADYAEMAATLLALDKICDLKLVVTGTHLEKKFGYTISDIIKDGLTVIEKMPLPYKTANLEVLTKNLGHLLIKLGNIIKKHNFDYVLVEGDRIESLAMAIAAKISNLPVIHQGGGDLSGSIDDNIRNAITSFSDYHIAGNINSQKRLLARGISPKKVFMLGEPELDDITSKKFLPPNEICAKYKIDKNKPLILALQHPDTKEKISARGQIKPLLQALAKLNLPSIVIYPNNDPGGRQMIEEINKYRHLPFIKIFPNLPRADFLGLMNICNVMAGNSSGGLIETILFNIPSIIIASRQKGRAADANVINCGLNRNEIMKKIKNNLNKKGKFNVRYVYGRGNFTGKFINFLKKICVK